MKEIKNVQGSQETIPPLEFNVDTVYVRSNIVPVDTEEFKGWQYDEIQYDKDEYIMKIDSENKNLITQISDINMNLADIIGGM